MQFRRTRPRRLPVALAAALAGAVLLQGCERNAAGGDIRYPDDAAIAQALRQNFGEDPDNAKARELIQTLGGAEGQLDYKVRRVIWRQGSFEVHYDASLRMAQGGEQSLQRLYATMIPKEEAARLPDQSLKAQQDWLNAQADALARSDAAQGQALKASLENLGRCYRQAKAGDTVPLMEGLHALLSPAREGLYAERLQAPGVQLKCLPL
ncbi:hypothetical protein [Pseudacidovorax sp.]|uniref:hypothetical protein n=1 Tax=Pseudacidovorax sp. TaxID=1934311 RepID=UPI0025D509FE|nr:hypothetical protein [Pseudacidovorax sp.]